MAIFLDQALDLPPTSTDFFDDDDGKIGEASINRLAASGHHRRLRHAPVLPDRQRHARADGGLPAAAPVAP